MSRTHSSILIEQKFICAAGCDTEKIPNETTGKVEEICVGGENDGMEYCKTHTHLFVS